MNTETKKKTGPKPRTDEKLKRRMVPLSDREFNSLVSRHGSFANAVRTLLIDDSDEADLLS